MIENYLSLIKHDFDLLDLLTSKLPAHLKNEDFSDWDVTVLFYMSCIYLKAVCKLFGDDVQDHYTLRQIINTKTELFPIAKDYRHLEEASRDARYEGRKFKLDYITNRLLPKFCVVRDCAVNIFTQQGISNIPTIEPKNLLKRTQT